MPDKALLEKNAELESALTKLRAEVVLAQATLEGAKLCSISAAERIRRMRSALEDIQRRTGPESVLVQALVDAGASDEVAELHQIATTALAAVKVRVAPDDL
ncbi:MAG: hypothetical protein JWM36_605 [Hyphomicrobiales bacterium]|nr:hypothetical protein [Hyphomicrobiales bacterium]